jgi:hypothetical protein
VLLVHFDPLDQAPNDLPARVKIRLLQPIVHFRGKGFQASYNKTQLFLHLSRRFEVLHLGFQMLQPGTHTGYSRFKFLLVNQALSITIDQTCHPSTKLAHLALQAVVGLGLLLGMQALSVGLLQAFGLREQTTDFVPDRCVRLIHTQRLVPTHALEALPRNIHRSCAAVIRIAGVTGAPTIGIPALTTNEQALK